MKMEKINPRAAALGTFPSSDILVSSKTEEIALLMRRGNEKRAMQIEKKYFGPESELSIQIKARALIYLGVRYYYNNDLANTRRVMEAAIACGCLCKSDKLRCLIYIYLCLDYGERSKYCEIPSDEIAEFESGGKESMALLDLYLGLVRPSIKEKKFHLKAALDSTELLKDDSSIANFHLGMLHKDAGDYDGAIPYFLRASHPRRIHIATAAKYNLGLIYYNTGKIDESIKYLTDVPCYGSPKKHEKHMAWALIAFHRFQTKSGNGKISFYIKKAIKSNPHDGWLCEEVELLLSTLLALTTRIRKMRQAMHMDALFNICLGAI
jgi:tetratricopeptide (TPR) repeat protein